MPEPPVPFLDLATEHRELEGEILEALLPLIRDAAFVGGEAVSRFEEAFAALHGLPHCVGVKSGTSALRLALEAMGVEPGDEVIVPAFTFIATATAVLHAGARPVFADVDDEVAALDPEAVRAALTPRTRVLLPVHLYGHPAPLADLQKMAREHGLRILEDCAQSHGASLDGRPTGAWGDLGAYSFYPTKNLGAAGDAGCVVTASAELAARVRSLANHGRTDRYFHDRVGWNERLDAIQAAVLTVKLGRLQAATAARREAATRYRELLKNMSPFGFPLRLPVEHEGATAVYHLYVVRHPRRDDLARALGEAGIGTATHYPTPLPSQPAFAHLGLGEGSWPRAEAWAAQCLSLPLFPHITAGQQERVAEVLAALPR